MIQEEEKLDLSWKGVALKWLLVSQRIQNGSYQNHGTTHLWHFWYKVLRFDDNFDPILKERVATVFCLEYWPNIGIL